MSALTTRSPYLRNRLLLAVDGLRKDAEQARLNVAAADQDVAAARALLAEAEAQRRRARDELDGIETGIAWAQAHAATITREIDADPAAKLRATGLMRHEPKPVEPPQFAAAHIGREVTVITTSALRMGGYLADVTPTALVLRVGVGDGFAEPEEIPLSSVQTVEPVPAAELPGMWEEADFLGGQTDMGEPPCDCPPGTCKADPFPDDDLVPPGAPVKDSRAEIAPHLPVPPPVPHDPAGQVVATHGPTVTMPDTGLAPDPLPPADVTAEPRHAKPDRPGLLARLTGGHRTIRDEQDGDQTDG